VASCQLAEPIPCGATIRLTHVETQRNLHSHPVESPLSRQQEVTGFGEGDANGDGGDNWIVQCRDDPRGHKNTLWEKSTQVRFFHVDTQKYLGTSKNLDFNQRTCGPQCPIMGHLEAFARASVDNHGLFQVDQGIVLHI